MSAMSAHAVLVGNNPEQGLCEEPMRKCLEDPVCGLVIACYQPCKALPPFSAKALRCTLACHQRGLKLSKYVEYNNCVKM